MDNVSRTVAVKDESHSSTTMEILESLSNGGASVPSAESRMTTSLPEPKTFDDIDFSQYYIHESPIKTEDESFSVSQNGSCFMVPQDSQLFTASFNSDLNSEITDFESSVLQNEISTEQKQSEPPGCGTSASETHQITHFQGVEHAQNLPQPQHFIYGYVYCGQELGFVPVVATAAAITNATTTANAMLQQPSSSDQEQVLGSTPFYSFYPQTAPNSSTAAYEQEQTVFLSGLLPSQSSQPQSHSKPSRRSKRSKSVSASASALASADGADESLVVPEPKAQGTFTLTGEKIRRPPNAFMIFAKSRRRELLYSNRELSNKDVSKMLGQEWNNLPVEERESFKDAANELRREHQAKYPGYCYNPMVARRAKQERKLKHEQKRKQSGKDDNESTTSSGSDLQQVLLPDWPPVFSQQSVSSSATVTEDTLFDFDESELYDDNFL